MHRMIICFLVPFVFASNAVVTTAQPLYEASRYGNWTNDALLSLTAARPTVTQGEATKKTQGERTAAPGTQPNERKADTEVISDIDEFFNVREANPKVERGGWELEIPLAWSTRSHKHDEVTLGF